MKIQNEMLNLSNEDKLISLLQMIDATPEKYHTYSIERSKYSMYHTDPIEQDQNGWVLYIDNFYDDEEEERTVIWIPTKGQLLEKEEYYYAIHNSSFERVLEYFIK